MNFAGKSYLMVPTLGIAFLIGSAQAQAQSSESARKRSFAELLSRRAERSDARSERADATASRTGRSTADSTHSARSTTVPSVSAPAIAAPNAMVVPVAGSSVSGTSSATPITPSGYGTGRDAFVESLYTEILGREADQGGLDYWSRTLAAGLSPRSVALDIWYSQEHRTLVREHEAPHIPFNIAYRTAYAAGLANKQQ